MNLWLKIGPEICVNNNSHPLGPEIYVKNDLPLRFYLEEYSSRYWFMLIIQYLIVSTRAKS